MPRPTMLQIYDKAESCGGTLEWDASQSVLYLGEHAGRGICLAASCYYVQKHKAGGSFKEFMGMYMNGRTFVPINMRAVGLLQVEQRNFRNFDTPAFNSWLNHKSGCRKLGSGSGRVERMSLISSISMMDNGYMIFGFLPPTGDGHAVAAHFDTRRGVTRVRFYDANFGEFIFSNSYDFFRFFDWLLMEGYRNDRNCAYSFLHLG